MAKPEWGVKRICPSCATRFYDLLSDPIVCPACNATFAIEAFSKPRRGKAAVKAAAPVKAAAQPVDDEDEVDASIETEDEDAVLDLGDDDDAAPIPETASSDDDDASSDKIPFSGDGGDDILSDDEDEAGGGDDDEVSLDMLAEGDDGDDKPDDDDA